MVLLFKQCGLFVFNRPVLRLIDEFLFVIETPPQTEFIRFSITGLLDSEGAQPIKSQRVDSSSMENSLRKALASWILCWLARCLKRSSSHLRKRGVNSWDDCPSDGWCSPNGIVIGFTRQLTLTRSRMRWDLFCALDVEWVHAFNWMKTNIPCCSCEPFLQGWFCRCRNCRDGILPHCWQWEPLLLFL